MLPLLRFSIQRPRLTVAVIAVLAVAATVFIPRIGLRLEGRALIPPDHPSMEASDRESERFELRDVIVVAVHDRDGTMTPRALTAVREIGRELAALDGVVSGSVASLATMPRLYIEDGLLDLRPLLDREAGRPEEGGALRDTALRDTAVAVRRESVALGLDDDILLAADHEALAIYAEVADDADRYRLRRRLHELVSQHSLPGLEIHCSGTALAQAVLGEAAARDLAHLVPLVMLIMAAVLTAIYRRLAPALISLAEIGVSLVWTAAWMGLTGQNVFVTTLALPVVLIVIGVSDDVYALNRYFALLRERPDLDPRQAAVSALEAVHRPILLTAMTTGAGLLCLTATNLEPQRVFGLFGALAVAFSTLLTFTLVPALLVIVRPRPAPAKAAAAGVPTVLGERWMDRWFSLLRRTRPAAVLIPLAVLVATAAALATRVEIGDSWVANLPPESDTARGDRAINRLLAGTNTVELALDSGRPSGFLDPGAVAALGSIEDALLASREVGAVDSLYSDVVRVNAALQGRPYREYRAALARGEGSLDGPRVEQALLLLDSLGSSPRTARLDPAARRTRMTVFVNSADYSRVGQVLEVARTAGAEAFGRGAIEPFGDGWVGYTTIRLLVVGQVRSIALAVVSDTVLLVLLFGSLLTALIAVSPVVVGIVLVFGSLAATGTALGTASSMFAAIALGVGVDYSIHLVATEREHRRRGSGAEEAVRRALIGTGPAILTSAVAIAAGFSLLGFSSVMPNRQLGLLVASTMTVCAIVTLVLIPFFSLHRKRLPSPFRRARSR